MIQHLPEADAVLNSLSAILLVAGFYFIRRRQIQAHKACMLSAFGTSVLFLGCYLTDHFIHGIVRFPGHGLSRLLYLTLLGTHTVLAAAIVPLVLVTLTRALKGRFDRHRAIARWTLPIWIYVSVTGVAVYWILYRIYGAR
jgi:uncharacterized membrane protein YozB (DUF420 family)